jgi:hypothetical protein
MSNFTSILTLLSAIAVNVIAIRRYAYDEKLNRTCDDYILNSYLYVVLAFLIMGLTSSAITDSPSMSNTIVKNSSTLNLFIITIVYLGIYYVFYQTNPKNGIQLHILWLVLILMISLFMYFPLVMISRLDKDLLYKTIGITLTIVVLTAYIGINYGNQLITTDFDKYLRWALIALIAISFAVTFIPQLFSGMNYYQITMMMSIPGLIIFILLLLSYNKKLKEKADTCHKDNNPNYPKESINIFIKIVNIIMDVFRILFARKNKGKLSSIKLK